MGKYEQAYAEFIAKYDLNLNVQTEYNGANRLASLDDFVMSSSPEDKARNVYISTLSSALTDYISKKVKIEPGKNYDLANIDVGGFIAEFDKVIDAIRSDEAEKEKTEYTHRKFEGLPFDRVANEAWARVAPGFNKPLHEIWAGQIRKGSLSLEQLQRITNSSTRLLDDMTDPNRSYSTAANKDLADVITIKNAMETAISKRSWISYLNPFNWGPYGRESSYLRELNGKINTYRESNFPVDDVVPAIYTGNMLEGAQSNLTTYIADYKKANPTSVREPVSKKAPASQKAPEPEKIPVVDKNAPISQQIDQIRSNPALCEPHYKAIGDIVAKYTNRDVKQLEGVIRMAIFGELRHMEGQNALLEKANQGVVAIQKGVREMAVGVFEDLYEKLPIRLNLPQGNHSSIAVVQEVTNYLMKNFSPVLQNPEEYGKYADNYVVKVESYLTEITKEASGSWTFTAARDLLKIKPEEVMQEPEQIISEVEKEETKPEEVVDQPVPEENEPEFPNDELLDSNLDIKEEEDEEPVVENESAEPEKPLGKMSKYMEEFDSENLFDAITNELYGETMHNNSLVYDMVSNNMKSTVAMLQECAEKFDSAEQPDSVTMDEISLKVFERAEGIAATFSLRGTKLLVMTQKIANVMMRLASPVALDEETYAKYADNYILSNDELLSKAGDYSDSSIEEARDELDVIPIANVRVSAEEQSKREDIFNENKDEIEVQNQAEEFNVNYEPVDLERMEEIFGDEEQLDDFLYFVNRSADMPGDDGRLKESGLIDTIRRYNQLFNKALKEDIKVGGQKISCDDILKKMSIDVFKDIYGVIVKATGKPNSVEAIDSAQGAVDCVMERMSAVYSNEDAFEKYNNYYLIRNEQILAKALGVEKVDPETLQNVRQKSRAYPDPDGKEEVDNLGDIFPNPNEPQREKLNLKPEDLENPAPEQNLSAKANEVPVKENNSLAK